MTTHSRRVAPLAVTLCLLACACAPAPEPASAPSPEWPAALPALPPAIRFTVFAPAVIRRSVATFPVQGIVTGLEGELVLESGSTAESVTVSADGPFSFPTFLRDGERYSVSITRQPARQQCTVSEGSGAISAAAPMAIRVECTTLAHVVFTATGALHELRVVREDGEGLRTLAQATGSEKLTFKAVTPDGKIVYEHRTAAGRTDVRVVNWDGTGALALASSADEERFLALVDGVVFFERVENAQADLYSVKLDGSALTAIAASPSPELFAGVTSTGFLLWLRHEGLRTDFFRAPVSGGPARRLTETPHTKTFAALSAAGVAVFFDADPSAPDSRPTLMSLDVATGRLRWLSDASKETPVVRALWGEQVLFSGELGSTLAALDGSRRVVFAPPFVIAGELPTGSLLVNGPGAAGSLELFVAEPSGTLERTLGSTPHDERFVSPLAGARVLISRGRELVSLDAEGQDEASLGRGDFLSVLPDGRVLFRDSGESACSDDLRAVPVDGSEGRAVVSALCRARLSAITPSGDLVVTHQVGTNDDLLLVKTDGSLPRVLANTTADELFGGLF